MKMVKVSAKSKIVLMMFVCLLLSVIDVAASESLKTIKHENMSFEARVPLDWLLKESEKSVRYSMSIQGGKMDVKHWPNKSASNVVDKLNNKISLDDKNYIKSSYLIGNYRVVSFTYEINADSVVIKQSVNVIDTNDGLYVVQFAAKKNMFNQAVIDQVLASFRVLVNAECSK
jgi:hypothetical protein